MVRFGRSISTHFVISRQIRVWPPDTFLSISSFVSSNSFQFFLTSFDWFFNYVCCCFVFWIYFINARHFSSRLKQRMCKIKPVDFPIAVLLLMQKSPRICQHNQLWHRCTMPSERKWVYYGRVLAKHTGVNDYESHKIQCNYTCCWCVCARARTTSENWPHKPGKDSKMQIIETP